MNTEQASYAMTRVAEIASKSDMGCHLNITVVPPLNATSGMFDFMFAVEEKPIKSAGESRRVTVVYCG